MILSKNSANQIRIVVISISLNRALNIIQDGVNDKIYCMCWTAFMNKLMHNVWLDTLAHLDTH